MANSKFINLGIAHYKVLLWLLAFMITVGSAIYQKRTGPTYPLTGKIKSGNQFISYKFLRSQTVDKKVPIVIPVSDTTLSGYVQYVRYKSHDEWRTIPLQRDQDSLIAYLPQQPPAGKLMYFVYLEHKGQKISLTGVAPVILRYRGNVPVWILIPHVLLMFLAMLFSTRTGLEALDAQGKAYKYMLWTLMFFFVGGFILGPLVQKFAFGALWTGFPAGSDLTDNKTLIAMLAWLWAWYKNRQGRDGRSWIVVAAALMLAVYLIPHSILGSEIDYTKIPQAGN